MKYLGSKNRIAKHVLPLMLEGRTNETWVEPFVGGANMIDKVDGKRIGADKNDYLIHLFNSLQNGYEPPKEVSKEFFFEVKANKDKYPKELYAYLGFALTFGCEWWGSFRRDNTGKRRYDLEAYNNVMKQDLRGIDFICSDYKDLEIPKNSIIYCDPPYEGVRKYIGFKDFKHNEFWEWCRNKVKQGHKVFVSEYNAPKDFECIWEKEISASANNSIKNGQGKKATEKLFVYCG